MPSKDLESIQGYCDPKLRLKERMMEIKSCDRYMTQSRIVEEALKDYLPKIEARFRVPVHEAPGRRKGRAA